MARFALTDFEWSVIQPLLPTDTRGLERGDDRRVLNGILWKLRTGAPWADVPQRFGPHTTLVNRFNRWRRAGVWALIVSEINKAYSGHIRLIDAASIDGMRQTERGDQPDPVAWLPLGRQTPVTAKPAGKTAATASTG